MQLATAGNLEHIRTLSLLHPQCHIGLNLLKEAVTKMAGGNKLSLTAGKRAGVDAKGHGQGRLIYVDCRQCLRILCISHRIADAYIAETGQADDLAHGSLRHLHAAQALIGIYLAYLCLGLAIAIHQHYSLVRLYLAADNTAYSHLADILISLQGSNHHLQRSLHITLRSRNLLDDGLHQRLQISIVILHAVLGNTVTGSSIDAREIQLLIISIQLHKELQHLVINIIYTLVRTVNLIDNHDWLQALLQSLTKHILGLRHRPLKGIYQQYNAVNHVQDTLHLAAEVSMARGINDVDLDAIVHNSSILGKNCNASFTLQIAGVHNALGNLLVGAENMALLQHGIHQGSLAVVNVSNNSNIPQILICTHRFSIPPINANKRGVTYSP